MEQNKLYGFFQEENGNYSSTRLIFIIGMLWAMSASTLMAIFLDWSAAEFIAVFTAISAVPVGIKLGQKPMETKTKQEIK